MPCYALVDSVDDCLVSMLCYALIDSVVCCPPSMLCYALVNTVDSSACVTSKAAPGNRQMLFHLHTTSCVAVTAAVPGATLDLLTVCRITANAIPAGLIVMLLASSIRYTGLI